jgi:hypothetical protein
MAIRGLSDDLNIIAALDDEPNDTQGLTANELKSRFDEGANIIKTYLNDVLIPDIGDVIGEAVGSAQTASGNLPTGGSAGQVLVKASEENYDTEFSDVPDLLTPETLPVSAAVATRLGLTGGDASVDGAMKKLTAAVGIYRAIVATAAATAAKTAAVPGFALETGVCVVAAFTYGNTAASPSLNVAGTGAKAIFHSGSYISPGMISQGITAIFQYDGIRWVLLNPASVRAPAMGSFSTGYANSPTFPAEPIVLGFRPKVIWFMPVTTNLTPNVSLTPGMLIDTAGDWGERRVTTDDLAGSYGFKIGVTVSGTGFSITYLTYGASSATGMEMRYLAI